MTGHETPTPQEFVEERRDELVSLIRHEDPFIRTIAFAVLLQGGDEADLETVHREIEILSKLGPEAVEKLKEVEAA